MGSGGQQLHAWASGGDRRGAEALAVSQNRPAPASPAVEPTTPPSHGGEPTVRPAPAGHPRSSCPTPHQATCQKKGSTRSSAAPLRQSAKRGQRPAVETLTSSVPASAISCCRPGRSRRSTSTSLPCCSGAARHCSRPCPINPMNCTAAMSVTAGSTSSSPLGTTGSPPNTEALWSAFPDGRLSHRNRVVTDDAAAAELVCTGSHTGALTRRPARSRQPVSPHWWAARVPTSATGRPRPTGGRRGRRGHRSR